MKAVLNRRYGPPEVLGIETVQIPEPKAGEVRIRIEASSVTSGDVRLRAMNDAGGFWLPLRLIFGLFRPRQPISGMEFSGTIDAVGEQVDKFRPGDAVFGKVIRGANAEYLVMPAAGVIAPRPRGLTSASAAAIPFGALAALAFLRDFARVKPGERVLVVGASGAVGVFAVQLARQMGAVVTGVCSDANAELVRSLGAHRVIDYRSRDYTQEAACYDVILDTLGVSRFSECQQILAPDGRHVFVSSGLRENWQALWTSLRGGKRVVCGFSAGSNADLQAIASLIEAGVLRPVIDSEVALDDIVAAHRYVESGRKRGALVVRIAAPAPG